MNDVPTTKVVRGIRIPSTWKDEVFEANLNYQPEDDDIFIVTTPKSGTTWMQCILYMIKTKCNGALKDVRVNTPFLAVLDQSELRALPRPHVIKTHLFRSHIPWSEKAKYIYITRNPFDMCTSFYHHVIGMPKFYQWEHGTFDQYFELFLRNEIDFSSYFENMRGWYEEKDQENVLFLTYEEMKSNIRDVIGKVVDFLGGEFKQNLADDPDLLDRVIEKSSFDSMSKDKNDFSEGGHKAFVRKGIIGDFKSHFSDEQMQRMKARFKQEFNGTPVMDLWKEFDITFD